MSDQARPPRHGDDARIGMLVREFTDLAVTPFDAREVARLAITTDVVGQRRWGRTIHGSRSNVRLMALAAALLTAALIGGAILAGAFGPPSRPLVLVVPSASASNLPTRPTGPPTSAPSATAPTSRPSPATTPSSANPTAAGPSCKPVKYTVKPGRGQRDPAAGRPPAEFGLVAGTSIGTPTERPSWTIEIGSAGSAFRRIAQGNGDAWPSVESWSADRDSLLVSVAASASHRGPPFNCVGLFLVRANGSNVVTLKDGSVDSAQIASISPSGQLVAMLERTGTSPSLVIVDATGRVVERHPSACDTSDAALDEGARLAWSPDSTQIGVGCGQLWVSLVHIGDVIARPIELPAATTTAMAWMSDGSALVVARATDDQVTFEAIDPGTLTVSTRGYSRVRTTPLDQTARFSPDAKWLIATFDGPPWDAYVIDSQTGWYAEQPRCADGCQWVSDTLFTVPPDSPDTITGLARANPDGGRAGYWDGGGFSFFTPLAVDR
jgi:hypothetical protein